MISRKIWVAAKLLNFHTVECIPFVYVVEVVFSLYPRWSLLFSLFTLDLIECCKNYYHCKKESTTSGLERIVTPRIFSGLIIEKVTRFSAKTLFQTKEHSSVITLSSIGMKKKSVKWRTLYLTFFHEKHLTHFDKTCNR